MWHYINARWRLYDAEPRRRIAWADIAALLCYIASHLEPKSTRQEDKA